MAVIVRILRVIRAEDTTLSLSQLNREEDVLSGSARQVGDLQERWLSFLARNLTPYRLVNKPAHGSGFQIEARARSAHGFTVARVATAEGQSRLEGAAKACSDTEQARYIMYTSLRGRIELSQHKRHQACDQSVSVMVDAAEPFLHAKLGNNDTLCFVMPRRFVEQRVANPRALCLRPLTRSSSALGRLSQETLTALQRDAQLMTESDFDAACRLVGDLMLLALNGSDSPHAGTWSVRQGTLAKVKRTIRSRLNDSELTLSDIAGACDISLGYLHTLFREDGRTAWEFLNSERLNRARLLLESPDGDNTVTEIGLSCGYSNLSQFSTAFRHAFGMSPRDLLRRRVGHSN